VDAKYSRSAAKRDAIASRASDERALALPRACRLVHRAEYDAVYREGRRRSSREFTIFVRPNGLNVSRFGWSIKKALGSAVRRNRIRRRMREILRLHRQEIAPGWDIVIHPRSSVATAKFLALGAELLGLLPRAEKAAE
jgi:ribonuclease P protein component